MKKRLMSAFIIAATLTVSTQTAFAATTATYKTEGTIEFKPSMVTTLPVNPMSPDPNNLLTLVNPTDPEKTVDSGTAGPFSIDFASCIHFGNNDITNKDMTYYTNV